MTLPAEDQAPVLVIGVNCHARSCVDPEEGTIECVCGLEDE